MARVNLDEQTIAKAFAKVKAEIEMDDLELCRVTEPHFDAVIDFVGKYFFPDEPASRSLGLELDEGMSALFREILKENISMMAVSDTGDIAGVRVIQVLEMGQNVVEDSKVENDKLRTMMTFVSHRDDNIQFYKRYGVSQMWHLLALATSREFRRRGIGTKLLTAGVQLGRELGYTAVKGEGTSIFSKKIYERVGFDILDEFMYDEYRVDGEIVFKNMGEHKSARIYGMQL